MEIKQKQQSVYRQGDEVGQLRSQLERELTEQGDKIERAQKAYQSKYNNVRSVKGAGFDDSKENVEVMVEIEQTKQKHLLNALA